LLYDMHIHSEISVDSDAAMADVAAQAFQKGLGGICFTEHVDFGFPDPDPGWHSIDLVKYSAGIEEARERYPDKWIGVGIEAGMHEGLFDETKKYLDSLNLDFVIGSVHVIDNVDTYTPAFFEGRSKAAVFTEYLQAVLHCIQNFSAFNVLGHITFPSKFAPYADARLYYDDTPDLIDAILETLISGGKGLEINTSAYQKIGTTMPCVDILKRYKQLGGDIITLGSDAHRADRVAQYFSHACEIAKEAGFDYACRFEEMRPVFYRI
jgi:histidinol-phosphatase (PHP family)